MQKNVKKSGNDVESKKQERLSLLKQIKEITDKEQLKTSKKNVNMQETKEYLKSVMIQKNREKELAKQAQLREEHQTIQDQLSHFEKMEKRYKDIFVAIGEKDQKIQNSYTKLKPEIQNHALAESERDKSIDKIITKQKLDNQMDRDKYDQQMQKRKCDDIRHFKHFNDFSLNLK